jgi:hypothetical protein
VIIVTYFYKGLPFVIVGAVVLLAVPYLGLIIFGVVALLALAALVWAIVSVPYKLGRAIVRRWEHADGAGPRTAPVLSTARHQNTQPSFVKGHAS